MENRGMWVYHDSEQTICIEKSRDFNVAIDTADTAIAVTGINNSNIDFLHSCRLRHQVEQCTCTIIR